MDIYVGTRLYKHKSYLKHSAFVSSLFYLLSNDIDEQAFSLNVLNGRPEQPGCSEATITRDGTVADPRVSQIAFPHRSEPPRAGRSDVMVERNDGDPRGFDIFVGAALVLGACGALGRKTTLPSSPSRPAPTQQPPASGQAPLKLPPL
jgi:hypothetical protein